MIAGKVMRVSQTIVNYQCEVEAVWEMCSMVTQINYCPHIALIINIWGG